MNFTTSTKNNTPRAYPKQRAKTNDLPTVRLEQRPAGNWVTYLNDGSPFPSTLAEQAQNARIEKLEAALRNIAGYPIKGPLAAAPVKQMALEALLCSSASIKK